MPVSAKQYIASMKAGKNPFENLAPKKSLNREYVAEATRRGYEPDSAELMADVYTAFHDIKRKNVIEHTFQGGN